MVHVREPARGLPTGWSGGNPSAVGNDDDKEEDLFFGEKEGTDTRGSGGVSTSAVLFWRGGQEEDIPAAPSTSIPFSSARPSIIPFFPTDVLPRDADLSVRLTASPTGMALWSITPFTDHHTRSFSLRLPTYEACTFSSFTLHKKNGALNVVVVALEEKGWNRAQEGQRKRK